MKHSVQLPYPAREGITIGCCTCNWLVTYSWGEYGDATSTASEHIEQAEQAEPIVMATLDGTRTVIPGRSL